MRYFFLIFFIFINFSYSNILNINKEYSISYGIFGELGVAKASIKIDKKNNYIIQMTAKATGFSAFLSQHKKEIYISKGKIINNKFVPNNFSKIVTNDVKTKKSFYKIDHKNKKVDLTNIKTSLDKKTNKWDKIQASKTLEYYAKNDILSLFFNLKDYLKEFQQGKEYDLYAIGANENNGLINIFIPNKKEFQNINKDLKTTQDTILKVFINQKIFSSARGELLISLDKDGYCDKAVLKDVLMFGDIRAKLIN
jgi:hypothetical protein